MIPKKTAKLVQKKHRQSCTPPWLDKKKQHLFDGLQYNFLFGPDVDNMRLPKWIRGIFEGNLRRKEKIAQNNTIDANEKFENEKLKATNDDFRTAFWAENG